MERCLNPLDGSPNCSRDYSVVFLSPDRIRRAKAAYTTRRVPLDSATTLLVGDIVPHAGDLMLAQVRRIGKQKKLELANGRRASLFRGDEVVVCYGNRYAPDQYEALVPGTLAQCHLVAAGGVAARVLSKHDKTSNPTRLVPLGLLGDADSRPLNLSDFTLPTINTDCSEPIVLSVVGTAMNSGKTTAAASLIRGLTASGLKVGAAKVTGTGAGKDLWLMMDAGAHPVFDFIDAGFASTYREPLERIEAIVVTLLSHLINAGVDSIVLEVADGLYQEETAHLLSSGAFKEAVDGVVFSAGDALGAKAGVEWLIERGLPVLAVSGSLTLSPLAVREAQEATGLPILASWALCESAMGATIRGWMKALRDKRLVSLRAV